MAEKPLTPQEQIIRERLIAARKSRKWSQAAVAQALGMRTKHQYIKIEQRGSVPKWLLGQFSQALGIPVELLIPKPPVKIVAFPAKRAPRRTNTKQ